MLVDPIHETRTLLRISIIEHLCQWWARDALIFRRLRLSDHDVDPAVLRQLARAYGVSRGILEGREAEVGRLILTELADWPDDLVARATVVRRIATQARDTNLTRGLLLSAFSKLVWFIRPSGWTLYDSYARAGLNAPKHGDDFDSFYARLRDVDFTQAMSEGRATISRSAFPYLYPERIHDVYLMLCSGSTPPLLAHKASDDILDLWAQFHGPDIRDRVEDLIGDFTRDVADLPAFQVHTLDRGK